MRHERIPLADPDRWQAALAGLPHAFGHTWGSCHAMQLTSGLDTALHVLEDGARRVAVPLAVRHRAGHPDVLTPYGFSGFAASGPWADLAERWAEHARAQGWVCGYLGLHPAFDEVLRAPDDAPAVSTAYLLDLTLPEDALFARLSTNRRRQLRAWERGAATLVTDRAVLAEFVGRHLAAFLDERRAARVAYLSPATLAALFALPAVTLLGAAVDGRLEAVSAFAHAPYIGEYLFNVSLAEGRRHSAPLVWQGARHLRALGVPMLNLGGPIRPGDGVGDFKARFGARAVPLRALRQVYDPERFAALCRAAGVDPAADGFFPPYHAR